MSKYLTLNLDELFGDGFIYSEYDISDSGHSITICAEDKDEFLEEYAEKWKEKVESMLEEDEDFEEDEEDEE